MSVKYYPGYKNSDYHYIKEIKNISFKVDRSWMVGRFKVMWDGFDDYTWLNANSPIKNYFLIVKYEKDLYRFKEYICSYLKEFSPSNAKDGYINKNGISIYYDWNNFAYCIYYKYCRKSFYLHTLSEIIACINYLS